MSCFYVDTTVRPFLLLPRRKYCRLSPQKQNRMGAVLLQSTCCICHLCLLDVLSLWVLLDAAIISWVTDLLKLKKTNSNQENFCGFRRVLQFGLLRATFSGHLVISPSSYSGRRRQIYLYTRRDANKL